MECFSSLKTRVAPLHVCHFWSSLCYSNRQGGDSRLLLYKSTQIVQKECITANDFTYLKRKDEQENLHRQCIVLIDIYDGINSPARFCRFKCVAVIHILSYFLNYCVARITLKFIIMRTTRRHNCISHNVQMNASNFLANITVKNHF